MKCEICHKNDAQTALVPPDGSDEELYVCAECAGRERARRQKKRERTRKAKTPPEDAAEEPPQILRDIVDAVSGLVHDIAQVAKGAQSQEAPTLKPLALRVKDRKYTLRGRLHLEGLHLIGEIDPVYRALRALGLSLDGVLADGVSEVGHVYNVCHEGEGDRLKAERVVEALVEQERNARVRLFEEMPRVFGDSLCRALAILKNCRLLSPGEYFDLLSPLRLAACEDMLDGITREEIEKLMDGLDLESHEDTCSEEERENLDAERADLANRRFEDVLLNERGEQRFL